MTKPILAEGYGIMPNIILFDDNLSSTAKLVMCHIMSLAAGTGTCRPRNKYLADKFHLKPRQVTNILEELGVYIDRGIDEKGRRFISLAPEITGDEGGSKKLLGGRQKIAIHSNNNSIDKKYTSEMLTEIDKVYKAWLVFMVIDPEIRSHATPDEKHAALKAAMKRVKLTDGRKSKIATRIKSLGADTVKRSVRGLAQSDFHRGENDKGWTADIDWLFTNDERVEKWSNSYTKEVAY